MADMVARHGFILRHVQILILVAAFLSPALNATDTQHPLAGSHPECVTSSPNGPVQVTAICVDSIYSSPVIDSETKHTSPVPYHQVSGHFDGTEITFNLYFPPKSSWQGRFFQHCYPLHPATPTPEEIAFGAESGAYTVKVKGTLGYRHEAAAAKFSKIVAANYYNETGRIYGYLYGASGGSFQAVAAAENTEGVWDGFIPMVQGVPMSLPFNSAVKGLAELVLSDKASAIADSVSPGGDNEPHDKLSDLESAILLEATKMGLPLRSWEQTERIFGDLDILGAFLDIVQGIDPSYADDFWSAPGYLGSENSQLGDIVRAARVQMNTTITMIAGDPAKSQMSVALASVPESNLNGFRYTVTISDDSSIVLGGTLDKNTHILTVDNGFNKAPKLSSLAVGQPVYIDNTWNIALRAIHRYKMPHRPGFYGYDQFLDASGAPVHPQRSVSIPKLLAENSGGGASHTGAIKAKMIVFESLLDIDAYPWHADWYKFQVQQALNGSFNDSFRLWINDNTDHGSDFENHRHRIIDYGGILQQALRYLAQWVEESIPAPESTCYQVLDSQLLLAEDALTRKGIQPLVDLTVNNGKKIIVTTGTSVSFAAIISVPPGAGQVVDTEWDFLGVGEFSSAEFTTTTSGATVETSFAYSSPGTYYAGLRATTLRDPMSNFAKVSNMDRVRVVVKEENANTSPHRSRGNSRREL